MHSCQLKHGLAAFYSYTKLSNTHLQKHYLEVWREFDWPMLSDKAKKTSSGRAEILERLDKHTCVTLPTLTDIASEMLQEYMTFGIELMTYALALC